MRCTITILVFMHTPAVDHKVCTGVDSLLRILSV